ncbi:MAG: hypothetical protein H0V90_04350 [Blastocatellia bacterium]|nr:hypothetical protein [Blastocatellia bacterium]
MLLKLRKSAGWMLAPTSCFDRTNTAVSQLQTGKIDWQKIFGSENGSRWFHTGGIFSGLSETTTEVALEAMQKARENGAIVSYDLNYRDSLSGKCAAGGRRPIESTKNFCLLPM